MSLRPPTRRVIALALLAALPLAAARAPSQAATTASSTITDAALGVVFPASVPQGAMVIGKVPTGSTVSYRGRSLRPTAYGSVVFGVGRDEPGPLELTVQPPGMPAQAVRIAVTPRDWPLEHVHGAPPATVNPPPEIARRIAQEQARVVAARQRDGDETGFAQRFQWPLRGRISGRFGNQRIYDDTPGAPHSGMDIAAPMGTPVRAPASGVVTFAAPDLYLTGGTLLLDHGHGISSNFLHLSRIDVRVGDVVRQGQVIGAVGATGRATGPHLHWGMNWFEIRIDPLLVLERGQ